MPHFVLGAPYEASGIWHYPTESYGLRETGLAAILPNGNPRLTANGERFDPAAMAAAHATLQLPAIARVTNLETGRAVLVRINDRGTGSPRRLIEVTTRVADLLGIPRQGTAQVRLEVLPVESHAAADALPGAPRLAVAMAPRGAVATLTLPPPPGTRQGSIRSAATGPMPVSAPRSAAVDVVSAQLPEQVEQMQAAPGFLFVRLDTFQEYQYAVIQRARLAALRPTIVTQRSGRGQSFRVQIGPLPSVGQADAVLDQAIAAGISDARIVVE